MSVDDSARDIKLLKKEYKNPPRKYYPYTYFEPSSLPVGETEIEKFVSECHKNKIGCIIPCLPKKLKPSVNVFLDAADLYEKLADIAAREHIKVGFKLEKIYEESIFSEDSPVPETIREEIKTKVLIMGEYYCDSEEHIVRIPDAENLMAVTAFDEDHNDSINLTYEIENGTIDYQLPPGNWTLKEYFCLPEDKDNINSANSVNKLNYRHCKTFINIVFELMGDIVKKRLGKEISVLQMSDICFDAHNRRNWDKDFNRVFLSEFNIDPTGLYDALFYDIGEKTTHVKTLFMTCRAKMLSDGIIKALRDFSDEYNIELIYDLVEPKLPSCSWLMGDSLANQKFCACAVLDKAYMYGINSVRLSSSAAVNFGLDRTMCQLFEDYSKPMTDVLFKDAMNAYAMGADLLLTHPQKLDSVSAADRKKYGILKNSTRRAFCSFASKAQSLLCGGDRICDIAVLYPIYSMHSRVFLYHTPDRNFEYPDPGVCNDYMILLNSLSSFCSQDSILLHPETLNISCRISPGRLELNSDGKAKSGFKIIIIPGTTVIDLENILKIKEFYDNGGKIIATVCLPSFAAGYDPGKENDPNENDGFMRGEQYGTDDDIKVRDAVKHIFGEDAVRSNLIRHHFYNKNDRGGEAYFIPASKTDIDGSFYTDERFLKKVINSFKIPLDVFMSNLIENPLSDGFNGSFPVFSSLGLNERIPYGGVISHIHKSRENTEIFYFANTTVNDYHGYVYLKGALRPEFTDPVKAVRKKFVYRYVNYLGQIYTAIGLKLEAGSSVFIISPRSNEKYIRRINDVPVISSYECNFLTE